MDIIRRWFIQRVCIKPVRGLGAMFDFKFDWDNSMNLGVDLIDTQHQELFKIARNMEQLILKNCIGATKEQLLDVVCNLREYVTYHFYQEEEIMKSIGYENFEEHKKLHDSFRQEVIEFRCEKLNSEPYEAIKTLKDELQEWVFTHVLIEDRKLIPKLKEKGYMD